MKVLVTGAKGFVGKNLCLTLESMPLLLHPPIAGKVDVLKYDIDSTPEELDSHLRDCDFVIHLAGINRPKDVSEFTSGNKVFTEDILERLAVVCHDKGKVVPVILSSSIQAALENDYGKSKLAAEQAVRAYGKKTGSPVFVFRLANVFGKWCRPNYNSAVATWCYNVAHNLEIQVRDNNATVNLVYIDDVVNAFVDCLAAKSESDAYTVTDDIYSVCPCYTKTLGEITDLIKSFHAEPETLMVPDQADGFAKKLYSTYLSYLPEDKFSYPVTMHCDARGSFTEILHTAERGQVSVNISKPGITKGQHWHHTKHEKFCVVKGTGLIQFRKMDAADAPVLNYEVSGDKIEVVRIPPGYTHNIINKGTDDMVTLMWANEVFDPAHPDTFREEV